MDTGTVIVVVLLIAMLILPMWLGRWRMNRAARQVIDTFIRHGAIGPRNAKTVEELGLVSSSFGRFLVRDFRKMAMMALLRSNTLDQTEDGKLYLTQEAYNAYISAPGRMRR